MEILGTRRRRRAKASKGPTLHDVARAAGVSSASVSRALSRPELVSEAVLGRVIAAIGHLGYVPNVAAQTLSGRSSRLVGAVASTLNDPVTMQALESLTRELGAGGVALALCIAEQDVAASRECVHSLIARGADTIVFCGGAMPIEPGAWDPDGRVCIACLDEGAAGEGLTWSGFDRIKMFVLGARYLQQLGHVRIGFLGVGADRHINRARGMLAQPDIDILDAGPAANSSAGSGVGEALDHWCKLPNPPTAVICGSDMIALAVLRECRKREIEVPAQWSVIGFGDTEISRQARPALTTLRVPAREAGQALARALLASLEGRAAPPAELSAKLVARESTAPIRR